MNYELEKYTHLYTNTLRDIQNGVPIIVHEGGTSSGKTYSTMQAYLTLTFSAFGSLTTVVGQDIPNLKKGPIRDAQTILADEPIFNGRFEYNKSDRILTNIETDSQIEFNSYDDAQDAKSGKRDYAFFNEANGIPYDVYDAINVRTSKSTVIDFNPSARFWAHDKIFPDVENRKWYKSNYQHNPFIPKKIRDKILSYEPTPENIARGTANEYRWKVYGLGELGRLEGLVFPNFKEVTEWPDEFKWEIFGLDFGFTNDPTALIQIRLAHGELFIRQLIYDKGLTNPDIVKRIYELETFDFKTEIVADSAEPKSIRELNDLGLNVTPAEKGSDSIMQGINLMQQYKLNIHHSAKDMIEEFSSYTWKKDKNGNPMNKPIDDFNHGIDAGRYALMKKLNQKPTSVGGATINF